MEHEVISVLTRLMVHHRGEIGIQSDKMYIQARGATASDKYAGLHFTGANILPRHGGTDSNNVTNLGNATHNFNNVYADDVIVRGVSAITDGIVPLSPQNNDLNYQSVNNRAHLRMPAIVGGENVTVAKTNTATTISAANFKLLAQGYFAQPPAPGDGETILDPDMWHAAPINYWEFQHPTYVTDISGVTPTAHGFIVPNNRRMFIEYGAQMGFAYARESYSPDYFPVYTEGPMMLRLANVSGQSSNVYEVSQAHAYTNTGDFRDVSGSYYSPGGPAYTEFRIEGRWPAEVHGSWTRTTATSFQSGSTNGPRVAWVKIWDTEIPV